MERLTKRNKNDRAYFPECFNDPCNGLQCAKDDCEFLEKVCEKLAECEDKEEPKKVIKICTVVSNEKYECPKCGNRDQDKMNVARRTCGYIGTQFWNQGRTQEIKERVLHL